jgi:prepilin-type N-terminal cleavage/methylation domain-containing protein
MKWRGFTLIELLVVVAIIGILSTIMYGPIQAARVRSRDTTRKANLNLIAQAVDLYYAEKKVYPDATGTECPSGTCSSLNTTTDWVNFSNDIQPYLPPSSSVPVDPINKSPYFYAYTYNSSNGTYTLTARLENSNDLDGSLITPGNASGGRQYVITR